MWVKKLVENLKYKLKTMRNLDFKALNLETLLFLDLNLVKLYMGFSAVPLFIED